MRIFYSRRTRVEEKRNIRKAFLFLALTLGAVIAFIFVGLPIIVKIAGFLLDLKKSSQPVEVADSTPPSPPQLEGLPPATNSPELEIKGSAEPGSTVTLFANSKKVEVLSNKDGDFSYQFSLLDGENTLSTSAKDGAGNESQKSPAVKVVFDNDPPELTISSPPDRSEFFGSRQRQVTIAGQTEEGASININGRQVVVEADGTFSFATTLSEGENGFTIKAQDAATNSSEKSLTLFFTP